MRAAICDDESVFRRELKEMLNEYASARRIDLVSDEFGSGRDLTADTKKYDVIFMDYQMNGLNGLDTSRRIRALGSDCIIIFVSAYPDIAIDTFEVSTFRFLTKPVDKQKLFKALDDYLKSTDNDNLLVVKTREASWKIKISDIVYVEAKLKHCIIRTADNTFEIAANLKHIERQLPPDKFARCQRSYIAGFRHIVNHSSVCILFDNGEKAVIGKKYLTQFKKSFQDYIMRYNEGRF